MHSQGGKLLDSAGPLSGPFNLPICSGCSTGKCKTVELESFWSGGGLAVL